MSHYEVLGVNRRATPVEVKRAFRAQARRWHPDLDRSPESPERFRQVVEAWAALGDPHQRRSYDAARHCNPSPPQASGTISFVRHEPLRTRVRTKIVQALRRLQGEQPRCRVQ